jgi:hypothetical protein
VVAVLMMLSVSAHCLSFTERFLTLCEACWCTDICPFGPLCDVHWLVGVLSDKIQLQTRIRVP